MPHPLQHAILAALDVRQRAYAPYSNYFVGAALVATNDQLFIGCNVENASYPAGICAERAALVSAVSAGVHEFSSVVIVTENGGAPCGVCRQMLYEFAPDLQVILVRANGDVVLETSLRALLPHGFGPNSLHAP
ncbi:MAG: cytidine deaminase [Phototrophicaceae bacterium]|jgi:cytidine deaminase